MTIAIALFVASIVSRFVNLRVGKFVSVWCMFCFVVLVVVVVSSGVFS